MTLPRTHRIPVLAIAAGGTVGALLTIRLSCLLRR
jgi:hypothetical protein